MHKLMCEKHWAFIPFFSESGQNAITPNSKLFMPKSDTMLEANSHFETKAGTDMKGQCT